MAEAPVVAAVSESAPIAEAPVAAAPTADADEEDTLSYFAKLANDNS